MLAAACWLTLNSFPTHCGDSGKLATIKVALLERPRRDDSCPTAVLVPDVAAVCLQLQSGHEHGATIFLAAYLAVFQDAGLLHP